MGSNHIGVSKGVPRVHVRKKSQAFELTPGQTLLISILEKLNYLRGSIGLCENHRRLDGLLLQAAPQPLDEDVIEIAAATVH